MSETNGSGIIKFGKLGVRKLQYEDFAPVEVDLIAAGNAWAELARDFAGPDGTVPPERRAEFTRQKWLFASKTLGALKEVEVASPDPRLPSQRELVPAMDLGAALHFFKVMEDTMQECRPFFLPKSAGRSDSPTPSELTVSEGED